MKIDLLKEHYFFELNRKQSLESALSLPIAILTGIGGVIVTLSQTFEYPRNWITWIFVPLIAVSLVFLGVTFYCVCRAAVRHVYHLIPPYTELLQYLDGLEKYYASDSDSTKATTEFENDLKQSYAGTATANKNNNELRAHYLYRANVALIPTVSFLALSIIPYSIAMVSSEKKPIKVEIETKTNTTGANMQNEKEPSAPTASPNDNPTPAESPQQIAAPEKPAFPNEGTSMGEDPTVRITTVEIVQTVVEKPSFPAEEYTKEGDVSSSTKEG